MFRTWKQRKSKLLWMIIRMILNCSISWTIFSEPGFIDELCGPLAIPANPELYQYIVVMEVSYLMCSILLRKMNLLKNTVVFFVKLSVVFKQQQRLRYYIHVLLIETGILMITGVSDFIDRPTISEVWEIIAVDFFHRIAIFYQITRTFCPGFALYWFLTNLFLLVVSQVSAHVLGYIEKSERLEPIYPFTLYVKQDVYRVMILILGYFGLFAVFQVRSYGYGIFGLFVVCVVPFLYGIQKFYEGEHKKSLMSFVGICLILMVFLKLRVYWPGLFKKFMGRREMCSIFGNY